MIRQLDTSTLDIKDVDFKKLELDTMSCDDFPLILDCSKVKLVPSMFCSVILDIYKKVGLKGKIELINVPSDIKDVLIMCNLDRVLRIS